MVYLHATEAPKDIGAFAHALIPDDDLLRVLANVHQLVKHQEAAIYNAVLSHNGLYREQRLRAFEAIKREADRTTFRLGDADKLRELFTQRDWAQCLVTVAGVLTACSTWMQEAAGANSLWNTPSIDASPEFGGGKLMVGADEPGPVRRAVKKMDKIRDHDARSRGVHPFHDGLFLESAVVDGRKLVRQLLEPEIVRQFQKRYEEKCVKIGLASLSRGADLRGDSVDPIDPDPERPFVMRSTGDVEEQRKHLRSILERATKDSVSILVLPELRMPPALLETVEAFLRTENRDAGLLLVAAGSWHEGDAQNGYVNRCDVLDGFGKKVWSHEKLQEFRISRANVAKKPQWFREQLGVGVEGGVENIRRGTSLQFCSTPWGRIAVAICVGFFGKQARPLLEAARADFYLTPSMSPEVTEGLEYAKELVKSHHAVTCLANCGTMAVKEKGCLLEASASFVEGPFRLKREVVNLKDGGEDCLHIFDLFHDVRDLDKYL